jgi:hypothetical protein
MLEERELQLKTGRIIPQANEEYGYEDHYPHWAPKPDGDSAETLRRCAWEIAMAGAYGTAGESARRGVNIWPDTGGGWINGRGDDTMVMLKGYEHMVDFFTSFEWWKTEPHDELVTTAPIVWQSRERFTRCTCRKKETSPSNSTRAPTKQAGSARSPEKRFRFRQSRDRRGLRRNLPVGWIGQS